MSTNRIWNTTLFWVLFQFPRLVAGHPPCWCRQHEKDCSAELKGLKSSTYYYSFEFSRMKSEKGLRYSVLTRCPGLASPLRVRRTHLDTCAGTLPPSLWHLGQVILPECLHEKKGWPRELPADPSPLPWSHAPLAQNRKEKLREKERREKNITAEYEWVAPLLVHS